MRISRARFNRVHLVVTCPSSLESKKNNNKQRINGGKYYRQWNGNGAERGLVQLLDLTFIRYNARSSATNLKRILTVTSTR